MIEKPQVGEGARKDEKAGGRVVGLRVLWVKPDLRRFHYSIRVVRDRMATTTKENAMTDATPRGFKRFRVGEMVQTVLPPNAQIGLHELEDLGSPDPIPDSAFFLRNGTVGKVHSIFHHPATYTAYYTVEFAVEAQSRYARSSDHYLLYAVLHPNYLTSAETVDYTPRETTTYKRTQAGVRGTMEHQHNVPGFYPDKIAGGFENPDDQFFVHDHSHAGYHSHTLEELGI